MAKLLLRSKDFIKEEVGGSCGFFSSLIYTTAEHSHDFFEFFLITEGRVNHVVNRHKQVLRKGALVFIRPNDLHYYKKINNGDCQFFNLAFQTELAYDLFRFLGPAFEAERLLQPDMPPRVQLTRTEREAAKEMIQRCFIKSSDRRALSVELKKTVMELFTRYFPMPRAETLSDMPGVALHRVFENAKQGKLPPGAGFAAGACVQEPRAPLPSLSEAPGNHPRALHQRHPSGLCGKPSHLHGQDDHGRAH